MLAAQSILKWKRRPPPTNYNPIIENFQQLGCDWEDATETCQKPAACHNAAGSNIQVSSCNFLLEKMDATCIKTVRHLLELVWEVHPTRKWQSCGTAEIIYVVPLIQHRHHNDNRKMVILPPRFMMTNGNISGYKHYSNSRNRISCPCWAIIMNMPTLTSGIERIVYETAGYNNQVKQADQSTGPPSIMFCSATWRSLYQKLVRIKMWCGISDDVPS